MKAKVHSIDLLGQHFLVMARSPAGAWRDLIEDLKDDARIEVATGLEIYQAGETGDLIIGLDRYEKQVDPNQMPLEGVSETVDDEREPF